MAQSFEVVYESGVLRPLQPLPFEENQRLTVTVSEEKEEKTAEPDIYRRKEMEWLRLHRKDYPGEYVALDGDRLVAHHKDGLEVYRLAGAAGVERPLVSHIPPEDELPFGGW